MFRGEVLYTIDVNCQSRFASCAIPLFLDGSQAVEIQLPDFPGLAFTKVRVVEANVNAGPEGLVNSAYAVGGEKEDSRVIFQDPQEDCESADC